MKKPLANSALILASLIIGLFVAEISLRLMDSVQLTDWRNFIIDKAGALIRVSYANENRYDPLLGWNIKDNWTRPGQPDSDYRSGKYGIFLKPGEPAEPPKGAILAVGDSFTAGSGVRSWENWPAYLQGFLDRPVINAANGGWGVDQIVLRTESMLDALEPALVVVSFLATDIQRNAYRTSGGANKPYFLVRDGKLVHMNNPVLPFEDNEEHGVLRTIGYSYAAYYMLRALGRKELEYGLKYKLVDTDIVRVSCLLLDRLKRNLDERNIGFVLVLQYGGNAVSLFKDQGVFTNDFVRRTLACARELRIPTVDTWAPLKAAYGEGEARLQSLYVMHPIATSGGYGHMSAEGNRLVAKLIAQEIRRSGLPLGPSYPQ